MATPRVLNRSYTAHPHGGRNVNNIHHTVCLVKGDGTTLDLNLQRRRPGKYDVPVTSKSFMKLDNENISRRLRARLCSASRVYCGNNMLNLHKQMYHKPRPASVQYKWSPQKVTLALPTIQKEKVRPKTAAVVRFHHTDSKSTSMRPKSYPWFGTTKQREREQEQEQQQQQQQQKHQHQPKEQQHLRKEQQQQQENEQQKANDLDTDAAETSENGSESKESDLRVVENKDSPVHTDTGVSVSSESGSVQSRNQSKEKTEKKRKKRKKKKERKEEIEEDNEKRETMSSKMSADETETSYLDPRLSKRRGINSDDDYSTDISGDEEDRSV